MSKPTTVIQSSQWLAFPHFSSIIPQLCLTLYTLSTADPWHLLTSCAVCHLLGNSLDTPIFLYHHIPSIRKSHQQYLWNLSGILSLYTIFTAISLPPKFTASHPIIVRASLKYYNLIITLIIIVIALKALALHIHMVYSHTSFRALMKESCAHPV